MKKSRTFKRSLLMIAIVVFSSGGILAQVDSIALDYQKTFQDFNRQIEDDFKYFQSENDSIFYGFLKQSWEEFSLMKDQPEIRPKPKKQPVIKTQATSGEQIIYDTIIDKTNVDVHYIFQDDPDKYMKLKSVNKDELSFRGINCQLTKLEIENTTSNYQTEKEVAAFYKDLNTEKETDLIIDELLKIKKEYCLNDWAFLDMLHFAAEKNYSSNNERVLFMWYVMLHTEYKVKLGFNEKDLYLLLNFSSPIYYKPYLIVDHQKYYVFNTPNQNSNLATIYSYAFSHPNQIKALSLLSSSLPKFPEQPISREVKFDDKSFSLIYDQSLTEFYKTYPLTELAVYLKNPLSEVAKQKLAEYISPALKDRTEGEKLNFLLHFIQYSFPYQSDEEQFSAEKYMFAEETISFPYTDCEDRVVLLDKLVKEYTNLNSIVLLYPEHVVLGVKYNNIKDGAYVSYKGNNYYIADPTYLGAKFGVIMDEFKNISPQILVY